MAWGFAAVLQYGQESGFLYPTPTETKPYFALLAGEQVEASLDAAELRISHQAQGGGWTKPDRAMWVKEIGKTQPQLVVTNMRLVLENHKLGLGKRGQSLVGHVMYDWLVGVGARPFSVGLVDNYSSIALFVMDASGKIIRIEVDLIGRAPTGEMAQRLVRRIANERLTHSGNDDPMVQKLQEAASYQFVRTPRKYHIITVVGGVRVGGLAVDWRTPATPIPPESTSTASLPDKAAAAPRAQLPATAPFAAPPATAPATPAPSPAAWHSDPTGAHQQRYWDGATWTAHVSDAGIVTVDPL